MSRPLRPLRFHNRPNRHGRKAAKMAARHLEPIRLALGQLTPQEQLAKPLAERAELRKPAGFWPRGSYRRP